MGNRLRNRLKAAGAGRQKGVPNLQRTETGYINQWGVEITEAEKKQLESLANAANRKRKRQLAEMAKLSETPNRNKLESHLMGKDNDLIITPKSKSLQRFRKREHFESYVKMLKRVNSPDYARKRMQLYKANYIKAVKHELGGAASDIWMKVQMMPLEQFMSEVYGHDELAIHFVYGPEEQIAKAEQIRASLGMKSKE